MSNIKAILFDSDRTLNAPRTGHWFITPNFMKIVDLEGFTFKDKDLAEGFRKAYEYLSKILLVKTEEEEYLMFKEFYEIVLKEINYPNLNNNVIELLAKDNVYNDDKFLFFDDVKDTLDTLRNKYLLGVVSDTYPSLERVFINKDLRKYFSTFVMSSVHGSSKEEKLLFKIAIDELGIKPEEAVFVDDNESNLKVAEDLGMIPILIDVYNIPGLISKYQIIHSISELIEKVNLIFTKEMQYS